MRESDRQLVLARREEADMETAMRNAIRDKSSFILKSEHESLLKRREDELVADMRKQLSIGYSDMRQRTAEAVELSRTEHRKYIFRLEEDWQHFVSALAESMNEVTRIRTKHLDYGESENDEDEEQYDEQG